MFKFKKARLTAGLLFTTGISLFGLFLTAVLAFYPLSIQENLFWRKPLIGAVFTLICILGILAIFFPRKCSQTFFDKRGETHAIDPDDPKRFSFIFGIKIVHGHHPTCEGFAGHEFQIGNKTFCAACTGLLLGALITIVGTALFFFADSQINHGDFLVAVGLLGVALGLLQFLLFDVRGLLRLLLNTFFVLGAFFVLVGVDELVHSLSADLFLVSMIVFWLHTRIVLSQRNHAEICRTCSVPCKFREVAQ